MKPEKELPTKLPEAGPVGPSPQGSSSGAPPAKRARDNDDGDGEDLNEANYDEFSGYSGSLFAKDPHDQEDAEADRVYNEVDERLDERHKDRRDKKYKELVEKFHKERPKIQQGFSDLKRQSAEVTEDERQAITEVGDMRNKAKRNARAENFPPVPDSNFAMNMNYGQMSNSIDANSGLTTPFSSGFMSTLSGNKSGIMTPGWKTGIQSTSTDLDLVKIGQARNKIMDMQMTQVSDSVTAQKVDEENEKIGECVDFPSLISSLEMLGMSSLEQQQIFSVKEVHKNDSILEERYGQIFDDRPAESFTTEKHVPHLPAFPTDLLLPDQLQLKLFVPLKSCTSIFGIRRKKMKELEKSTLCRFKMTSQEMQLNDLKERVCVVSGSVGSIECALSQVIQSIHISCGNKHKLHVERFSTTPRLLRQ